MELKNIVHPLVSTCDINASEFYKWVIALLTALASGHHEKASPLPGDLLE